MQARNYNSIYAIPVGGMFPPETDSKDFEDAVRIFQRSRDLKVDGKMGPNTLSSARLYYMNTRDPKVIDKIHIADMISKFEGHWDSCNRDGEFRGLFDRKKKHWASGKVHIGLSFGKWQFAQEGGALGRLVKQMKHDDEELFYKIFGEHADEMLEVTNKKGRFRTKGRSPRVQPVGGHDLWEDYWVSKFKKSAKMPVFQNSQKHIVVTRYLDRSIDTCRKFNFQSERSLAIVFDRSIHFGVAGARRFFRGKHNNEFAHIYSKYRQHKGKRWAHRMKTLWRTQELSDQKFLLP